MFVAYMPDAEKHQEQEWIDDNRIRHREERHGAGAEGERGNCYEGIGGIDIAADQEPGNEGAESPSAQTPFMELIEIALSPMGGGKTQPCNEPKQQQQNAERNPVPTLHGNPPSFRLVFFSQSLVEKKTTAVKTALTITHSSWNQ